jgi:tripartite-type tricarboxylate transporter receptor subunit TctC
MNTIRSPQGFQAAGRARLHQAGSVLGQGDSPLRRIGSRLRRVGGLLVAGGAGRLVVGSLLVGTLSTAGSAAAQESYPTRPIRLIVGFAAGGPTDVIARVMAKDMTATLGQSVLVENKPGANSMIATGEVARAAPDGYTLLVTTLAHNVNPIIVPERAKYDPFKNFAPVSLLATVPMIAVTAFDAPYRSLSDVVEAARKSPGIVNYGSAGNGGSAHLAAAYLATLTDTQMTHVPFNGNGPALMEVMAGRVNFMFYPMIGVADQAAQKRLRALAITTPERHPDFPDVPTTTEAGFKGFDEYSPGIGLVAPAGTPGPVIQKLHAAVLQSLANPATQDQLRRLGGIGSGLPPAEFDTWLQADYQRWARVIKAANIRID